MESDNITISNIAKVTETNINGAETEIQFSTLPSVKITVTETVQTEVPDQIQAVKIAATNSAGLFRDKFDGNAFKMFSYLITLKLNHYTHEEKPILPLDNTDSHACASIHAWEYDDFLCKGNIQSHLSDQLYNVYYNVETSKELWNSLDKKCHTKDAGFQKYAVEYFQDYKMMDSRPLMKEVEELTNLLHEIHAEGMRLCDTYQVVCVIEKLPPAKTDFKNYLKLKRIG